MASQLTTTQIAVAGASGFVGLHLIERLAASHPIIALGRRAPSQSRDGVEWRQTELFSAGSTRAALQGATVAIYLVHSMMPSSRLFQGSFHDTDLLLADNFARACKKNGVQQIIYLGGLVPPSGFVSPHLQSRKEVEAVLAATGIPLTVLRAGMVVGRGGSSFEILRSLVQKLPLMALPRWTQSMGQAVHIDDVVAVLAQAVTDPAFLGRTLDLVNGESLNYETMLRQMTAALGLKRRMVRVPLASTGFSKRWVQVFGNASHELVSPLIDSLLCGLPQLPPDPLIAPLIRYPTFRSMLEGALAQPESSTAVAKRRPQQDRSVRSVQRLPSLPSRDAPWLAHEYMRWLPRFFRTLIRVHIDESRVTFRLSFVRSPLLVLDFIADASDSERTKLHIVGGLLSQTTDTGWLEFRQVDHRRFTLTAIHQFVPSLPWPIYLLTQAPAHSWVMHSFGRHLARLD